MSDNQSNEKMFSQYLSARNDFHNGKYKLATKKLLTINLVTDNSDVNHLLVMSLYRQKDYRGAERVLLQDINSYTATPTLAKLMINVLLKNDEFILGYEIIESFRDLELKQRLLRAIKKRERFVNKTDPKALSKIGKSFYHLSGVSLIRQRIILKRAQRLPLEIFTRISKNLLVDPFLSPIMRLSVLDILRKVGVKSKVKYRWINNRLYSIDVDQLKDLTKTKSYQEIMKIIESRCFHDPSRMVALKQVLRLDLSYLYPFNDLKIQDGQLWVKIAALRLQGKQPIFTNDLIKSVYFLQVKLGQLTKNLVK